MASDVETREPGSEMPIDSGRATDGSFDVCVIGGGVNGSGVARDLALRGADAVMRVDRQAGHLDRDGGRAAVFLVLVELVALELVVVIGHALNVTGARPNGPATNTVRRGSGGPGQADAMIGA